MTDPSATITDTIAHRADGRPGYLFEVEVDKATLDAVSAEIQQRIADSEPVEVTEALLRQIGFDHALERLALSLVGGGV